jgi:hypothetical protein
MRSPIESMIDAVVVCVKCGASKKQGCDCFTPIKLKCPHCKKEKMARREDHDPPRTWTVLTACSDCINEGDRPEVLYYDKLGRMLDIDGNVVAR